MLSLGVALAVEFADELADGTKGAAMPQIRGDLHLSYGQIGLLIAVPLLAGSLLELPLGLIAGHGRRRRRLILTGGLVFVASLGAVAGAGSFWLLLAALTLFFPASGAFVGLTQAALMDAEPSLRQGRMAGWNLAGSAGAVVGPLLLAAVVIAGASWRQAYLLIAVVAAVALAGAALAGPGCEPRPEPDAAPPPGGTVSRADDPPAESAEPAGPGLRAALGALRNRAVLRWLVLLQVCDLLLDVLTGFVAVYLVAVVHASVAQAAVGVAVRLGAGLAGDIGTIVLLRRVSGHWLLRASGVAALLLYPAFLLVPGLAAKLVLLAGLSLATASWYPLQQAGLYASLPGASGVAVSLSSAASLVGALGPLAVGFVAARFGLSTALACLAVVPATILALA